MRLSGFLVSPEDSHYLCLAAVLATASAFPWKPPTITAMQIGIRPPLSLNQMGNDRAEDDHRPPIGGSPRPQSYSGMF